MDSLTRRAADVSYEKIIGSGAYVVVVREQSQLSIQEIFIYTFQTKTTV